MLKYKLTLSILMLSALCSNYSYSMLVDNDDNYSTSDTGVLAAVGQLSFDIEVSKNNYSEALSAQPESTELHEALMNAIQTQSLENVKLILNEAYSHLVNITTITLLTKNHKTKQVTIEDNIQLLAVINYKDGTTGHTPLTLAIELGCLDIAQVLIQYGAFQTSKNQNGEIAPNSEKRSKVGPKSLLRKRFSSLQKKRKRDSIKFIN